VDVINSITGTQSGSTSLQLLSVIAVGTGNDDRDGAVIRLKGLQYAGFVTKGFDYATGTARLIIFRWDQGYRNPTTSDILVTPTSYSVYNQNETKNYKIMVDRLFHLTGQNNQTQSNYAPNTLIFKGSFKDDKISTFNDDTGTTADSKYWAFFCNDVAGSTVNNLTTQTIFVDV